MTDSLDTLSTSHCAEYLKFLAELPFDSANKDVIAQAFDKLKQQSLALSGHPNLDLYAQLSRVTGASENFIFEQNPCAKCYSQDKNVATKAERLVDLKQEQKFTDCLALFKLKSA
jgi:hypothetical protein